MRYFEDLKVGEKRTFEDSYKFTEEEIIAFASHWDPQPFHTDKKAAAESMFGGLVACSSHIIAAAIRVGIDEDPVAAVSALGFSNMKVLAPVRPGDIIKANEDILEARLSRSHPGCGIVTARGEISNQNKEVVFIYDTAMIVRCRG